MSCCSSSSPQVPSSIDKELEGALETLRGMQYELKSAAQSRYKQRDTNKPDSFIEMKSQIVTRLTTVRNLMDQAPKNTEANAKMYIGHQAAIRENVRQLNEEWRELEKIFQAESKKRKKNYSPEEAESRRALVGQLQQEIENIKSRQRQEYVENYKTQSVTMMEDSVIFSGGGVGEVNSNFDEKEIETGTNFFGNEEITSTQNQKLLGIRERDVDFDKTIYSIGQGVEDLHNLAVRQNEEVKMQNIMLEDMTDHLNTVKQQLDHVNSRMKTMLKEMSRR